jgi:hypothetical protein
MIVLQSTPCRQAESLRHRSQGQHTRVRPRNNAPAILAPYEGSLKELCASASLREILSGFVPLCLWSKNLFHPHLLHPKSTLDLGCQKLIQGDNPLCRFKIARPIPSKPLEIPGNRASFGGQTEIKPNQTKKLFVLVDLGCESESLSSSKSFTPIHTCHSRLLTPIQGCQPSVFHAYSRPFTPIQDPPPGGCFFCKDRRRKKKTLFCKRTQSQGFMNSIHLSNPCSSVHPWRNSSTVLTTPKIFKKLLAKVSASDSLSAPLRPKDERTACLQTDNWSPAGDRIDGLPTPKLLIKTFIYAS